MIFQVENLRETRRSEPMDHSTSRHCLVRTAGIRCRGGTSWLCPSPAAIRAKHRPGSLKRGTLLKLSGLRRYKISIIAFTPSAIIALHGLQPLYRPANSKMIHIHTSEPERLRVPTRYRKYNCFPSVQTTHRSVPAP